MELDFIRRGLHVDYRCGDEAPAAPALPAPSTPTRISFLAELRTPEQKRRGGRRGGGRVKKADHIAGAPKWEVGDGVYLAWSMLDDDQRLRLSTYRTTRGEVIAKQPGIASTGVRFNGDPEPVWFRAIHLARVPEAE